jgi:hypothetical protein
VSKSLILAGVLLGVLGGTPAALAQAACGEREEIITVLREKYAESHRASGLETASKMIEVWASEQTGTWTILVTQANGQTCVAASGQSWLEFEALKPVVEKES